MADSGVDMSEDSWGLPVVCDNGHVSEDRSGIAFGAGAVFEALRVNDNTVSCPVSGCAAPARVISGEFTTVDGVLRATKVLGSVDDWYAVIAALDQLPDNVDYSVAIEQLADSLPPIIASAVRQLPPPRPSESISAWKSRVQAIAAQVGIAAIVGTTTGVSTVETTDLMHHESPAVVNQRPVTNNVTNVYEGPVIINRNGQTPRGSPGKQPGQGEQRRNAQRRRVDPMKGKAPSRGNGGGKNRRGRRKP